MYLEIRDLVQNMFVLTRKMQEPADKAWRLETTYRALLLLRTTMAVIDYRTESIAAWDVPELDPKESAQVKADAQSDFRKDTFPERSGFEESTRVPPIMAFKLRWCLDTSEDRLSGRMKEFRGLGLFNHVDEFMKAYYA